MPGLVRIALLDDIFIICMKYLNNLKEYKSHVIFGSRENMWMSISKSKYSTLLYDLLEAKLIKILLTFIYIFLKIHNYYYFFT